MKAEAHYIPLSTRRNALFAKAAAKVGISAEDLSDLFKYRYFASMELRDFIDGVIDGDIKRESLDQTLRNVAERKSQQTNAPETPRMKAIRQLIDEVALGDDASDQLNYEAKKVLQIGDLIPASESKQFLSSGEYATKGKFYPVRAIRDNGYGDFTLELGTNFPREIQYVSGGSVLEIYRGDTKVWSRYPTPIVSNDHKSDPSAQTASAA